MSQDDTLDYQALQHALVSNYIYKNDTTFRSSPFKSSVLAALEPLRISPERLDVSTLGGSYGGFGDVFQGRLRADDSQHPDWHPVAIKQLRMAQGQDLRIAVRLAREMKVWADLKHPNIVPFVGFHLNQDVAWLISSWASNGNAHGYLMKANADFSTRLKLLLDAAEGLAYLHGRNPPVSHGDIKSPNVLISEEIRGMLGDFGLSRVLEADPTGLTTSRTIKGSLRYMSPELLNENMLTGQLPFHKSQGPTHVILELSMKKLPASLEEPPVSDLPPGLVLLLELCWKEEPAARPTMTKCVEVIRRHLQPETPKSLEVSQAVLLPREIKKEAEGWTASFNPSLFPSFNLQCLGELIQTTQVRFFPDGQNFAMIRYDGLACIVDTSTGQIQVVLDPSPGENKPMATVLSLSQNADRLAVANPGSIIVWDLATASIASRLEDTATSRAIEGVLTGMKLSGNGQFVAYITSNTSIHVWDIATNRRQQLTDTQPDRRRYMGAWPIAMSFDGRYTAVASVNGSIAIYSSKTGGLVDVLSDHKGPVAEMVWSLDASRLLSGSWDKSAKLWDVSPLQHLDETGPSSLQISLENSASVSRPISRRGSVCRMTYAAKDPIEWVSMARDDSWYVSCSADGDINFWDPKSGVSELKMKLKGWNNNAQHFDLGPVSATWGGWLAVAKGYQSSIWRYSAAEEGNPPESGEPCP
ncbi:hypothetical protein FS837_012353 [Tulasnella sp. UAMH 9824]|nr:hypothetical protein FS837_012353 [Tulasnella sp. UAMH 9824]